jgi:hypothetical protein
LLGHGWPGKGQEEGQEASRQEGERCPESGASKFVHMQ